MLNQNCWGGESWTPGMFVSRASGDADMSPGVGITVTMGTWVPDPAPRWAQAAGKHLWQPVLRSRGDPGTREGRASSRGLDHQVLFTRLLFTHTHTHWNEFLFLANNINYWTLTMCYNLYIWKGHFRTTKRQPLLWNSLPGWGNWGTERQSNLSQTRGLLNSRLRTKTQASNSTAQAPKLDAIRVWCKRDEPHATERKHPCGWLMRGDDGKSAWRLSTRMAPRTRWLEWMRDGV